MNMLVKFARSGPISFCSHLDLLRCVQRTMRRSGIPMQYSQGFNPHPILTFAQALGVGLETRGDYFAVGLLETVEPQTLIRRFNEHAPNGLKALCARDMAEQEKSPMALVEAAIYRVEVESGDLDALHDGVNKLLATTCYTHMIKEKEQNIRPLIHSADCDQTGALFCVSCGNENLSHKAIADVLSNVCGIQRDDIKILREDLLSKIGADAFISLIEMHPSIKVAGE